MISIEEQIDRLKADANWLFYSIREYHRTAHGSDTPETGLLAVAERIEKAADMLSALKARAEAAEKRIEELEARIRVMEHDHGIDLSLAASRAEAAEEQLDAMAHKYRSTEPI